MKITYKNYLLSVLVVLTISISAKANAFLLLNSFWQQGETTFRIQLPSAPTNGNTNANYSAAFVEAINSWNASSAFVFETENSVQEPCLAGGTGNSIGFTDDRCGIAFDVNVLAVAITTSVGGFNTRSRIVFNDAVEWDVFNGPLSSNSFNDFRRVAAHELGHALGLDHSDDNTAIMFPFVTNTETPQADDIAGVAARYDTDNDGISIADEDNCPDRANTSQSDIDNDGFGDVCDGDADGDGILNNAGVDQNFAFDSFINNGFPFGANVTEFGPDFEADLSLSQSFQVGISGALNQVSLPISCSTGDLTVSIRRLTADTNFSPPSNVSVDVLQEVTIQSGLVQASSVNIDLPERSYVAGDRLAIVAQTQGSCFWRVANTGSYSDGSAFFTEDDINWTRFFGLDFPFQTLVTPEVFDNCPGNANADQADSNNDGIGNVCDGIAGDQDGDSILDANDNCPTIANIQQLSLIHI